MDCLSQILVFGLVALLLFIGSVVYIQKKRYALGLTFGILELLSATVSSSAWAWALKISGKGDWLLLGILNYPPIGLACISMFVVGVLCVMKSTRGFGKKEN